MGGDGVNDALYFGDISSFLNENRPVLSPKVLDVLNNLQKCTYFHIVLAATADWGNHFVKDLEGDVHLTIVSYEAVQRILADCVQSTSPTSELLLNC